MSRTSGEPRQTPSGGGAPTPYGTGPSSFCEKEQYGAGGEGAEGEEGLLDEGLVEGEGSDEETWGSSGYDPGTAPSTASPGVNQTPRSNRISRQRRQAAAAAAGGGGGGGAASEGGGLGSGGAFSPLRKRTAAVASGGGGGGVLKQHCGVDEPYAPPDTRFGGDTSRGGGGGGAAKLPANYFLDEQEEIARHPFPIPPADLVEMARQVLAVGVYKWPHLSEDFQFSAPFIGPLGPEQFRSTLSSLELEEAFPDLEPRYHHLRVDPFRPNRVWVTLQPRCSHLGTFRGKLPFGIKPTGKVIEEPPQTASLTFNAAGQVEGYTMGYVMDRMVGNTNGLGGVFGLMWALGAPLPAPEGHPWSPSLQLRLVNSGVWLLQAAAYLYDRTAALFLPSSWRTRHSRNTM